MNGKWLSEHCIALTVLLLLSLKKIEKLRGMKYE